MLRILVFIEGRFAVPVKDVSPFITTVLILALFSFIQQVLLKSVLHIHICWD
jgi:hypothetical protein